MTSEWCEKYTLTQEYYSKNDVQRTRRILRYGDNNVVYEEDSPSLVKKGELYDVIEKLRELEGFPDKCTGCRYSVGDYSGDIGYLIYLTFRSRLRLKIFKFKLYFLKVANKYLFFKNKTTSI